MSSTRLRVSTQYMVAITVNITELHCSSHGGSWQRLYLEEAPERICERTITSGPRLCGSSSHSSVGNRLFEESDESHGASPQKKAHLLT